MRTRDDLKTIRFTVMAGVTLDLERVAEDPVWAMASRPFNIEDPAQFEAALLAYLRRHVSNEVLLEEMPSTCGPADVYGMTGEVVSGRRLVPETPTIAVCERCQHPVLVHGPEGCEVRTMKSGYSDFASLPRCGCRHKQA